MDCSCHQPWFQWTSPPSLSSHVAGRCCVCTWLQEHSVHHHHTARAQWQATWCMHDKALHARQQAEIMIQVLLQGCSKMARLSLTFQAQKVATSPTSSSAATFAAPTSYVGCQLLRHVDRLIQSYRGMFIEDPKKLSWLEECDPELLGLRTMRSSK